MDKLNQQLRDVLFYKKNAELLQTKIQILMEEMDKVQCHLIGGENDGRNEVQRWLAKADEVLKKSSGTLEGSNNLVGKKCLFSPCWGATSSKQTSKMLRDINKMLEDREGLDIDLSSYFCGLPYCKNLQSREETLQEILEALTDIHINMIGVYGMIGVGKTVLVQELARRARNNQLFDAIVMIQVTQSAHVDVKLIQTQIANQIGLHLSEIDNEETRACLLYNALEEKLTERGHAIMVILDGLWHAIDLVKVGIPCKQKGKSSCKVVLTSRNADACKRMGADETFSMECLNSAETKILFRERLGDKIGSMENTHESYQYVENVFLLKCRGLPLVINLLACALRSMTWSNWKTIADQLERHTLVELDEVKEVVSAILELCDNFIQNWAKKMFLLLCCLIPQGTNITVERLLRYGIGFGLFGDGSLYDALDRVNSWVDELRSLSLLLESNDPQHVEMNDTVRDVAIGDYFSHVLLDAGTSWHARETYENCIAISVMPGSNYKCLNGFDLHKLQALYLKLDRPSLRLPDSYFQGMRNLKILDISGTTLVEFPSSIRELKNLVTLHLEHCDITSISTLSNLEKLEVLSLRGSKIEALPEEIGELTHLRVLDLTCCKILKSMSVDAIAKLDQLRELYLYDSFEDWSYHDLRKLESLRLEVLEIKIPGTQLLPTFGFSFLNLRRFRIFLGKELVTSVGQLNSFSRVLSISGVHRLDLEHRVWRDLLQRTEFLQIEEVAGPCYSVSHLDVFGFLHLKNLYVGHCDAFRCFLDTSKSYMTGGTFPELEILTLEDLPRLEYICGRQPHNFSFPKLREVRLRNLELQEHYVLPVQLANTLKVLEVSHCTGLPYIFPVSEINETDGADKIVEFPCLEKLELSSLESLLAVQVPSEDEFQPCQALFNKKIKFPSLKEMCLMNLDQIENIWNSWDIKECDAEFSHLQNLTAVNLPLIKQVWGKEPCGRSFCLGNLRSITFSDCNNLESMFPSSNVISLLQLEELVVKNCQRMKEVIRSDADDESNPTRSIGFPKLRTLKLESMLNLQCFYQGCLLLEFPMLRELALSDLWRMKTFIEPGNPNIPSIESTEATLFTGKIDFPSLKHLRVSHMRIDLIKGHEDSTTFINPSSLTLEHLPELKSIPHVSSKKLRFLYIQDIQCFRALFSISSTNMHSMPLTLSQKLEELTLSRCGYLEELVDDEKSIDNLDQLDAKPLHSLRSLKLISLHQLNNMQWNMLGNLRSLVIHGVLGGSTSLLSTALLAGGNVLHRLEYIEVASWYDLEAFVSKELEEDQDVVEYGMTLFPRLKRIELQDLASFQNFCMGSYETHFPSLEKVKIQKCPRLSSFSLGTLVTPRLKYVELDNVGFDDLNLMLAALTGQPSRLLSISKGQGEHHEEKEKEEGRFYVTSSIMKEVVQKKEGFSNVQLEFPRRQIICRGCGQPDHIVHVCPHRAKGDKDTSHAPVASRGRGRGGSPMSAAPVLPRVHVMVKPQNQDTRTTAGVVGPSSNSSGFSQSSSSSAGNSRFSLAASGSFDVRSPTGEMSETPNLRIFSFAELKAATSGFKPETLLGVGGFGMVYRGFIKDKPAVSSGSGTGTVVAIRKMKPDSLRGFEQWQVNFLGSLSHPHLVKLLGYCLEDEELLLVYEYMPRGSLENHLFGRSVEPLPWDKRISIAIGAARGLAFLHSLDVIAVYRYFQTSNILLDARYHAKLSDVGLARFGPPAEQSHLTTRVMGTYGYAPPEYVATGHLYVNSDVYGFGVVLLEMLTGLRAIDPNRPEGQQSLVDWLGPKLSNKKKKKRLKSIIDERMKGQYPLKAVEEAVQLALKCLEPDPRSRPSSKEVVDVLQQIEAMTGRKN